MPWGRDWPPDAVRILITNTFSVYTERLLEQVDASRNGVLNLYAGVKTQCFQFEKAVKTWTCLQVVDPISFLIDMLTFAFLALQQRDLYYWSWFLLRTLWKLPREQSDFCGLQKPAEGIFFDSLVKGENTVFTEMFQTPCLFIESFF